MKTNKKIEITKELAEELGIAEHQRNGYSAIYTHLFNFEEGFDGNFQGKFPNFPVEAIKREKEIIDIVTKHDNRIRIYRSFNNRGTCVYFRLDGNESMMDWNNFDQIN